MTPDPGPPDGRRFAHTVVGYALFVLLSVVLLVAGQRLWRADFSAPFAYTGDALLILPMVKETVEHGTHWHTDRLGAPGVQELYDFPVVDHLHFAAIWLLGRVWPDPVAVFNLYHLLTYPLTVLTAMLVFRHFGLSVPAAGCGAVLYAFLPYHYLRGLGHYFLSAYYVVPLTCLPVLWVCQGRLPFFSRDGDGYRWTLGSRDGWVAVLIGVATASAGAYYAFFGCAFLAAAGLYGWVVHRTWRAAATAGVVTAVVVVAGAANHAPTFVYQAKYGRNTEPTARQPEEAEEYGLKVVQLLLPTEHHNWRPLAAVAAAYDSPFRPLGTENRVNSLGLIGAAGFVGLMAAAVLPLRVRWPVGPLAVLTLFGVLLGTVGGLGSAYAFFVSPQVRCYNRVAIYLAFFALFAACWAVDRFFATRTGRTARWKWPAFLLLTAVGVADETNDRWFRPAYAQDRDNVAAAYHADALFFAHVEDVMPGGMVFTLPFVPYPETLKVADLGGYDQVRGYLHTRTVRWSFGAMKGREADQWQREVAALPPGDLLRRLAVRGFDGLFVDRRGYTPAAAGRLFADLTAALGADAPRFDHPDGQRTVFDLRSYRERLRHELGDRFVTEAKADVDAVRVLWLDGFVSFEKPGEEWKHRWCGAAGEAVFVNPTDRPRPAHLSLLFRTQSNAVTDVRVEGGVWTERFPVNDETQPITRDLVIPPGRHTVRFRARRPPGELPTDSRRLSFFVAQFRMTDGPPRSP